MGVVVVSREEDEKKAYEYLLQVEDIDLIKYGLIPELVGRLPYRTAVQPLSVDDLCRILDETISAAEVPEPDLDGNGKAIDALLGLAAFPAEQVLAMSLSTKGLDLEQLWERKRQVIEQTPGLSVWRGGETFDDVGGCGNIKRFLAAVIAGEEAPRGIVFLDEIEKAFAGTGTDLSGVKTELTGAILSWMQDRSADGCLLMMRMFSRWSLSFTA